MTRPVVSSPGLAAVYELATKAARTTLPVLVLGETGSGKELVARTIHERSPRAEQPFKALNCATLPTNLVEAVLFGHERGAFTGAERRAPGIFEQAQSGTVFLDEVGELSPAAQAALLRVLEQRTLVRVGGSSEVRLDVRVIAATHRNLWEMVEGGTFREDLLFRLDVFALRVPPLRERKEEILPLAERFLADAREQAPHGARGFSPCARAALLAYHWPGNVRQLKNVVERSLAVAVHDLITVDDLPERVITGRASEPSPPQSPSPAFDMGSSLSERLTRTAHQAACRGTSNLPAVLVPQVFEYDVAQSIRRSAKSTELSRMIARVAKRPITVLVTGETGVGKELVARELHQLSARASGPFVVVNCAAFPEQLLESVLFGHVRGAFTGAERELPGVFVQADGGTLFLDEIGELSSGAQAALLRVLDTRQLRPVGGIRDTTVDVRVVAATHRDLEAMCLRDEFRADLHHRLNAVVLEVAPLRERREEIQPLTQHFLRVLEQQWGGPTPKLSDAALQALEAYDWPGNVRELRNVVERAVALCEGNLIGFNDLPRQLRTKERGSSDALREGTMSPPPPPSVADVSFDLRARMDELEATLIRQALAASGGRRRRAAELLNLPLRTLDRKLQQLGAAKRAP